MRTAPTTRSATTPTQVTRRCDYEVSVMTSLAYVIVSHDKLYIETPRSLDIFRLPEV